MSLESTILALEEETWRAVKDSGAALIPFLSQDCTMIFPPGIKMTPDSEPTVKDLLHSPVFTPWLEFEISKVNVTPMGEDGAIISYRVRASRPPTETSGGQEAKFDAICSSVWRMEVEGRGNEARLKMCFHQQTLVD